MGARGSKDLKEERTSKMRDTNRGAWTVIRTMLRRRLLQRDPRRSLTSLDLLASFWAEVRRAS
jgi:hypothetical protein